VTDIAARLFVEHTEAEPEGIFGACRKGDSITKVDGRASPLVKATVSRMDQDQICLSAEG
jgi:hypothetical protein